MRDIAVTVLTGFLGSGKTTLLNRLLADPAMAGTAVVINEFGEIGIDDVLIARASRDAILLNSGCVCCTVKDDLTTTLQALVFQALQGEISAFRRVVIETTGLADPGPVLQILINDPMLAGYYRVGGVITTVDAVNGARTLDEHEEAVRQAAIADRLLLTKADLAAPQAVELLVARLEHLNPTARRYRVIDGEIRADLLFDTGLFDPVTKTADVQRWLNVDALVARDERPAPHAPGQPDVHGRGHDHGIQSFAVVRDEPLSRRAFARWIETMAARRGPDMLRVKGIVNLKEDPGAPWVVHGVQDVFHPPARLAAWPTEDHRTRLVFVTRDLAKDLVEETLRIFDQQET